MSKGYCTYPDCTCPNTGKWNAICEKEEREHGKQLSFGERVTLEDGIDHRAQAKDEGHGFADFVFAGLILVIIVASAIGSGFYYAIKNTHALPYTDFSSRSIKVDLRGKDTVTVKVTEEFIYHYKTLTDEQKEELKKEIE